MNRRDIFKTFAGAAIVPTCAQSIISKPETSETKTESPFSRNRMRLSPTPKQLEALNPDARFTLFHGGRARGATWLGMYFLGYQYLGQKAPFKDGGYFGLFACKNHADCIWKFRQFLKMWSDMKPVGMVPKMEVRFPSGARVQFCDHASLSCGYYGYSFDRVFVDDIEYAGESAKRAVNQAISVARGRGPRVLISCFPPFMNPRGARDMIEIFSVVTAPSGTPDGAGFMHVRATVTDNQPISTGTGYLSAFESLPKHIAPMVLDGEWEV